MQLNTNQKIILSAGAALIVVMALFPPWMYTFSGQSIYSDEPAGYSFIASPPERSYRYSPLVSGVKLDAVRLSVQSLGVLALTAIGLLVFSGRSDDDS